MIEFGTKGNVVAMGFVVQKCAQVCRMSPMANNGGSCIFLSLSISTNNSGLNSTLESKINSSYFLPMLICIEPCGFMLNVSFEEARLHYLKYIFEGHSNILEEFGF
jgi:hypothetical protein